MDELISDYETGALHPADVKPALAKAINEILQVKNSLHSTLLFFLYSILVSLWSEACIFAIFVFFMSCTVMPLKLQ